MSQVDLDKLMQTIREQIDKSAASNDGGSVDSPRVDTVSSASPSGTTAADIPFGIDDIMELQEKDLLFPIQRCRVDCLRSAGTLLPPSP